MRAAGMNPATGAGTTFTPGQQQGGLPGQLGGNEIGATAALAVARSHLGEDEIRDEGKLAQFFNEAGIKISPRTTAWCAAFVNASLAKTGQRGTGSLAAASFYKYGTPVRPGDVQPGDIAVAPHHVAFVEATRGGMFQSLGGNQGGTVSGRGGVSEPWRGMGGFAFRRPPGGGGGGALPATGMGGGIPMMPQGGYGGGFGGGGGGGPGGGFGDQLSYHLAALTQNLTRYFGAPGGGAAQSGTQQQLITQLQQLSTTVAQTHLVQQSTARNIQRQQQEAKQYGQEQQERTTQQTEDQRMDAEEKRLRRRIAALTPVSERDREQGEAAAAANVAGGREFWRLDPHHRAGAVSTRRRRDPGAPPEQLQGQEAARANEAANRPFWQLGPEHRRGPVSTRRHVPRTRPERLAQAKQDLQQLEDERKARAEEQSRRNRENIERVVKESEESRSRLINPQQTPEERETERARSRDLAERRARALRGDNVDDDNDKPGRGSGGARGVHHFVDAKTGRTHDGENTPHKKADSDGGGGKQIVQLGTDEAKQHGGSVWSGRSYMVGEHGPELFMPGVSGNIISGSSIDRANAALTARARHEGRLDVHFHNSPARMRTSAQGRGAFERMRISQTPQMAKTGIDEFSAAGGGEE
jgi:hypothetical protein